jgi:single-strand DNA-binding protein
MKLNLPNQNIVVVSGRLTEKPEAKFTQTGKAIVDFNIAINKPYKGKDGEWTNRATFVTATLWGEYAPKTAEGCDKGTFVFVQGELALNEWKDKEGNKRQKLYILADKVKPVKDNSTATTTKTQEEQLEEMPM